MSWIVAMTERRGKVGTGERVARIGLGLLLAVAVQLSWAGATSEPLSVMIAAPDVVIRESNISLHVTMTNRSTQAMTLVKSNPGCDFTAEVKDADGREAVLTGAGTELRRCKEHMTEGRRILVTLKPGESTEETYPIELYYGMTRPGRYTVQLSREVPLEPKRVTRSNEVALNLE